MAHFYDGASGILFDCDGTLLNTMDVWNKTEEALFALATEPFTHEQLDEIRSVPIERGAELFHAHGVAESPQGVLDFLDTMLMDFYANQAEALPGVNELLAQIENAHIPCVVVTSSPLRYVEAGLACAGITFPFAGIVTTDEVGMAKSDPAIYRHALSLIDAQVETSWGVDDALYAVRTMNACGLRTVGTYECDETATFEQLEAEATIAVRSLEELL